MPTPPEGHAGYSFTIYAQEKIGGALLSGGKMPSITRMYLAFFTTAPTETGGGTEVSGGGYTRMGVVFGGPSSLHDHMTLPTGTIWVSSSNITFPTATADWGSIAGAALFDAPSGGNMWFYSLATSATVIANGDTLEVDSGSVIVIMD